MFSDIVNKEKRILHRSNFAVGLVRTFRGLKRDFLVRLYLAIRRAKIVRYLDAHRVRRVQLGPAITRFPVGSIVTSL